MNYDLETDIRLCKNAGFDLLELWADKLKQYLISNSTENLKNALEKADLKPHSINSM